MQFWSGTAFMQATEAVAVAPMLDEAGFDGIVASDHLIYPRDLKSAYPSPSGRPWWTPDTGWPDTWVLIGAMAAVTSPAAVLQRGVCSARAPVVGSGNTSCRARISVTAASGSTR